MTDTSVRCCLPVPDLTSASPGAPPRLGVLEFALGAAAWAIALVFIEPVSEYVAYDVLGLKAATRIGSAGAFFLYEVPHVLLLLVGVVFVIGVVNTYFTTSRVRRILAGRGEAVGGLLAALLGVVTPFCSCSTVPLFIGFVEAGVPLGVTLSFLVSAPIVNEVALVLLVGLFGMKIASLYLATGLAIAVGSGVVLGRLGLEDHVEPWVREMRCCPAPATEEGLALPERAAKGVEAIWTVVGKTWPYVLIGIAVGAFIHGWVPEELLAGFMGKSAWWTVPLAVALGVPMYAGTAALGTVLAFMMAVVGLSLPEFIMLRRVLRPKLLAAFVCVVSVGIMVVGWVFNIVLG